MKHFARIENRFSQRLPAGRQADFVIEGYVDPPCLRYGATSPREPLRDEGPFGEGTSSTSPPSRAARGMCGLVAHGTMR
ncbi:MAG: hypothetical protein HY735_08800 [Verrucomicrobia bacterium]|nr:hypothetical protein [Verrucomicrobiota bacterium]